MPDPAVQDLLRPYVTNLDLPVFALRHLPEEVVAVLFAYYSRSTDSLRDNLRRLLADGDLDLQPTADLLDDTDGADDALSLAKEKARQFHEKWVVGYGHGSVAEHAVVHLAIEDISIVATKVLEDNRLASYTEKSTRYVPFDADSFVREPSLAGTPAGVLADTTCHRLLGLYTELLPRVVEQVQERFPRPDDWPDRRYRSVCRSKAFDLLRYLLPAGTRTNVGLTVNARALEHLLTKLYSHPLGELRALAGALHQEALHVAPTLIKYAAPSDYLTQTRAAVGELAAALLPAAPAAPAENGARLLHGPAEPFADLAAAILYEAGHVDYATARAHVAALDRTAHLRVIDEYCARRGRFDHPLRCLEHLVYTFELVVDYGAFRDIQRHRMCTQTSQVLSTNLGYATPPELLELGHGAVYHAAQEEAATAHAVIAAEHGLDVAQYVLPLAWRKRLLVTWNLRELCHFIELRSGQQGHVSYRRLAQDCWRELRRVSPELASLVRVDLDSYDLARA